MKQNPSPSKYDSVVAKLNSVKEKGLWYHKTLERNVKILSFSYYEFSKQITIVLEHAEIQSLHFYDYELDEHLKKFVSVNPQLKYGADFVLPEIIIPVKIKPIKAEEILPFIYSPLMSENTNNNISALRTHLFDAIRKLEGGTMKADEAKAMASLAQTIINSAKLELDYKSMVEKNPDIKMLNS